MAKTRISGHKTSSTRKATTSAKTMNGKIVKTRGTIKKVKSGEEDLRIHPDEKNDFKSVNVFTIRLRRIKVESRNNPEITTLPVQCRTTVANEHKDINKDSETKNNLVLKTKRKATAENNTRNLMENKTDQNATKIKKSLSNTVAPDVRALNGMETFVCNKPRTRSNRIGKIQNPVDSQLHFKLKKCLIKLQRIPSAEIANATNITPCTDKTDKNQNIITQNSGKSFAQNVCTEMPETSPNVPVIDNIKRNNFRKLSLTKSFNEYEDKSRKDIEISKASTTLKEEAASHKAKVLTKSKNPVIKQIKKLSLKGPGAETGKDKNTISKESQFEPKLELSIAFNPVRNSTLLGLNSPKGIIKQVGLDEATKKTSTSKDRSSPRNLANKSAEIENLLHSLSDEEDTLLSTERTNENNFKVNENYRGKGGETESNISNVTKPCKFFHSKKQNDTRKNIQDNSRTPKFTENRRVLKRRSTKFKQNNTYDFLSQSQTSDSDNAKHIDPTVDVVKKLIKEGKVRVATNFKGKGKPKFKNVARPKNKKKQTAAKQLNHLKNKHQTKKVTFVESQKYGVEEDHFDNDPFDNDYYDNDQRFDDLGHSTEMQKRQNISSNTNIHSSKNLVTEQEGTFSRLARSVLINQADRSYSRNKTKAELLEKVKNIISTPKNKKSFLPYTDLQTDFSPIAMMAHGSKAKASPWRVNEDAYLPKTFNFNRSSGNLPSFSSDFIQSTQRAEIAVNLDKQSEKTPTKTIRNTSAMLSPLDNSVKNVQQQFSNNSEPSTISSFSSNDSNAENMPPPKPIPDIDNENENIFDAKKLPNPRRVLKNRSPLKAINILEVVHLPPYKNPNKTKNVDDIGAEPIDMFGFEKDLEESNPEDHSYHALNEQPKHDNSKNLSEELGDLFGFEEYLSQTDISSQEKVQYASNETNNTTIHDKLQCLRKLKPLENNMKIIAVQNSKYPIKNIPLFDDKTLKDSGMKQRGIKEMLCSTLLDMRPSTSKDALKQLNEDKRKYAKQDVQDENLSVLFADPEPETTFNESEAHRTYIRPYKRKRRLKENNIVLFLESDESGEEDNSAEQRKHQLSRESESNEKASKKKRQQKVPKDEVALDEFAKEFNELCKEVESYELVVEKRT